MGRPTAEHKANLAYVCSSFSDSNWETIVYLDQVIPYVQVFRGILVRNNTAVETKPTVKPDLTSASVRKLLQDPNLQEDPHLLASLQWLLREKRRKLKLLRKNRPKETKNYPRKRKAATQSNGPSKRPKVLVQDDLETGEESSSSGNDDSVTSEVVNGAATGSQASLHSLPPFFTFNRPSTSTCPDFPVPNVLDPFPAKDPLLEVSTPPAPTATYVTESVCSIDNPTTGEVEQNQASVEKEFLDSASIVNLDKGPEVLPSDDASIEDELNSPNGSSTTAIGTPDQALSSETNVVDQITPTESSCIYYLVALNDQSGPTVPASGLEIRQVEDDLASVDLAAPVPDPSAYKAIFDDLAAYAHANSDLATGICFEEEGTQNDPETILDIQDTRSGLTTPTDFPGCSPRDDLDQSVPICPEIDELP